MMHIYNKIKWQCFIRRHDVIQPDVKPRPGVCAFFIFITAQLKNALFLLYHRDLPIISCFNSLQNVTHFFVITFNVVEHPRNKLVPVIVCILSAINSHSLTNLSVFSVIKLIKQKTKKLLHHEGSPGLGDCYKALTLVTPSI